MPNHLNPAMLHGFCPFVSFNKTHRGGCEKKRCALSLHRRKGFGGRDPKHAQNTRTARWVFVVVRGRAQEQSQKAPRCRRGFGGRAWSCLRRRRQQSTWPPFGEQLDAALDGVLETNDFPSQSPFVPRAAFPRLLVSSPPVPQFVHRCGTHLSLDLQHPDQTQGPTHSQANQLCGQALDVTCCPHFQTRLDDPFKVPLSRLLGIDAIKQEPLALHHNAGFYTSLWELGSETRHVAPLKQLERCAITCYTGGERSIGLPRPHTS